MVLNFWKMAQNKNMKNRIKHYLTADLILYQYYYAGFGDPEGCARDYKVGLDPPVEKHCSESVVLILLCAKSGL